MEFNFDAHSHTYTLDDEVLPSVTAIIKPIQSYAKIPKSVLEHARQMGVATHKAVELWNEGDLDIDSLDIQIVPRFKAWLKFITDTGAEVTGYETPMYSSMYKYAGTPDLWIKINKDIYLLDIKPNSMFSWYPIQLSGYQHLLQDYSKTTGVQRATLQLKDDGKYKFTPYKRADDARDFSVFQSLLTIYKWRHAHD